ncbi:acetyltransferase-like protein [Leishmania major strain Friedlin]|uniref:Acetyltransferase-like protein n=1 Tax=Leishmania major TaxID=5664 RepID=Q53HX3_LEIMA|nr:acetyltransferase-like protein [Leishmania major strain Friedlin]AKK31314.1 acetyltransferase-like protein [Leishmania major]CAG9583809.1 acetyltransferase-like_protein [Leishmania major strain Friedlin]CAI91200.1 thialysine N6-acetyltransferase [Leishmania major]CAJ09234.1 acetyltransferase-like protein [Leishmania major strain Friedlin]|eukprot:XP_001686853.1 acetyltransferase-like protein [Leishmania major strain Friedlin]
MSAAGVTVRRAEREDTQRMYDLIMELAIYERAPECVVVSKAQMEEEGFGERPLWSAFVAELQETNDVKPRVIGMALYYYRYSTWRGRMLYLEDFIVTESHRGIGAGKMLFERVLQQAKEEGCHGMVWQALDWNAPAIEFYKKYDAEIDPGWVNCMLKF